MDEVARGRRHGRGPGVTVGGHGCQPDDGRPGVGGLILHLLSIKHLANENK